MEIRDRKTQGKLQAWVGILIFHSAHGEADTGLLGHRLQSIIAPIVAPEVLQEAARKALNEISSPKAMPEFKNKVVRGCTREKAQERIELMRELLVWRPVGGDSKCQTLGDLVRCWAELTRQDSGEFEGRFYPKLVPFVADWQRKTRRPGFTDEAVFQHPREGGEFMAGLIKVFLEETPQAKLEELMTTATSAIVETPGDELRKGLKDMLEESCVFTAWQTSRQVSAALESNPEVKTALSAPEVAAIVEYEEHRVGWGGNTETAIQLLADGIKSELLPDQGERNVADVCAHALRVTARRSLLRNLGDAVKGGLRERLIETVAHWIRRLPRLKWEVESLPNNGGIYQILLKGGKNEKSFHNHSGKC